jgi:hypothetical protein
MRFGIWYILAAPYYREAVTRFLETGGMPPKGIKLEERWHSVTANKGFIVASTKDPEALYQWMASWADLIHFEISPVLDDKETQSVLKSMKF